MNMSNPNVVESLQRIYAFIPERADPKAYLRSVLDSMIYHTALDAPMGIVSAEIFSRKQIFSSARVTVEKLDDLDYLNSNPEGIIDLGTIEWALRPSLPIRESGLEEISAGPWQHLPSTEIEQIASSVCRLDLAGGGRQIHIGTGFIIGENRHEEFVIMTNAHVVKEASRVGWTLTDSVVFGCDFYKHNVFEQKQLRNLLTKYVIHPTYDLALVFLPRSQVADLQLNPLSITTDSPNLIQGPTIGVIGHPSFNSDIDPFPKYFGFGNEFGIKRFSPGLIRNIQSREWGTKPVQVFLHDATTLSGSSGSCIIDIDRMKVIGLHFGGWHKRDQYRMVVDNQMIETTLFEANGAVPLWALTEDPILADLS